MRTTRMFWKNGLTTMLLIALVGACSDMQNWFGQKQTNNKPTTKARRPADEPAVAAADRSKPPPNPSGDAQTKEVDDKVDRYVKSMNNTYDPAYESNDLQSKMRRQSDPARAKRVQQTAAMSREPIPDSGDAPPGRALPPTAPKDSRSATGAPPSSPPAPRTGSPARASKLDDSPPLETETPPALATAPPTKHAAVPTTTDPKRTGKANSIVSDDSGTGGSPTSDDPPQDASDDSSSPSTQSKAAPTKPPVLGEVKIAAGSAPEKVPPKENEAHRPAANTLPQQVMVDTFKKRVEDQEALVGKDPNNVEEQFRLRLMYLVNGQEDKALAAASGMNADIQDIMQAQLKTLIAARTSAQRDPAAWANKQLAAVEELRGLVRSRADLNVPRVVLCKAIDGFGRYTPFEPAEFQAGKPNKVLLYVEVDNFSTEKTSSGQFRVLLTMRQSLLTKSGEELWSAKDENIEDLSRQRRRDFYLTAERVVPKTLNPGDYLFKVEIEDVLAGKINGGSVTFKLVP